MDPIDKSLGDEVEQKHLDLRGKSVAEILSILTAPSINEVDDPQSHASAVAPSSPPVAPDSSGSANAPSIMPLIADTRPKTPEIGLCPLEDPAQRPSNVSGLPAPSIQTRQWPEVVRLAHLPFVLILAVIVATGVTLLTFPKEVRKWSGEMSGLMNSLFEAPSRAKTPTKLSRLALKPPKGFVNEPLPLGVLLSDASGSEKVILAGLAIGTRLSAGTRVGLTSWEMLARDVVDALIYPPKDFVGPMVAVIDLRSAGDWLLDSQVIRLEWIQKDKERLPN
jgi:hypothetical protein